MVVMSHTRVRDIEDNRNIKEKVVDEILQLNVDKLDETLLAFLLFLTQDVQKVKNKIEDNIHRISKQSIDFILRFPEHRFKQFLLLLNLLLVTITHRCNIE